MPKTTLDTWQFIKLMRDWSTMADELTLADTYTEQSALQHLDMLGVEKGVAVIILGGGGDMALNSFLMGWFMRGKLEERD